MKRVILVGLVFLLMALSCMPIPEVSATENEENLRVTPRLPEDVLSEPMPSGFTTEDYLNTTNPYSDFDIQSPFDEINETEGSHPIYVRVFADEEERQIVRDAPQGSAFTWDEWAVMQLERGDESLAANFGIDIRILDWQHWDSDDSLTSTYDLWHELEADTEHYLGQWYDGLFWSNYTDAIIGITAQETTDNTAGRAPGNIYIDQGRIFILLKWQGYCWDDNLVQHEISHSYYPDDHNYPCCVMAAWHTHYQTFIWEDKLWWVFADIICAYTSYSWCTTCSNLLNAYKTLYAYLDSDYVLVVRHGIPNNPRGSLSLAPGIYTYGSPTSVTISASAWGGYEFKYWLIDGQQRVDTTSITISVNSKRAVAAYFKYNPPRRGGGPGKDALEL